MKQNENISIFFIKNRLQYKYHVYNWYVQYLYFN